MPNKEEVSSLRHVTPRHDPLHRLPGEFRDPIEVGVVVKHCEPGALRAGCDQQVGQRHGAVLRALGEQRLNLERSPDALLVEGDSWHLLNATLDEHPRLI